MRKSIRNLNNLSNGNQLRQGDKTPLVYELLSETSLANQRAQIRLYKGETIYLDVGTQVKEGNLVEFIVSEMPVGQYIIEITVNGYKFPSHEFETLNIVPSSETYILSSIQSVGLDTIIENIIGEVTQLDDKVNRGEILSVMNLLPTSRGLFNTSVTYQSFKFQDEPEEYLLSVEDKDKSVDMEGIYICTTTGERSPNGAESTKWIMQKGSEINRLIRGHKELYFSIYPNNAKTFEKVFQRYYIKIERGKTPTEWIPALEEIKFKISQKVSDSDSNASVGKLMIIDDRETNHSPDWYIKNHGASVVTEFKIANRIKAHAIIRDSYYCTLMTFVHFPEKSGGYPVQIAVAPTDDAPIAIRFGTSDTEWSQWKALATYLYGVIFDKFHLGEFVKAQDYNKLRNDFVALKSELGAEVKSLQQEVKSLKDLME